MHVHWGAEDSLFDCCRDGEACARGVLACLASHAQQDTGDVGGPGAPSPRKMMHITRLYLHIPPHAVGPTMGRFQETTLQEHFLG